MKDKPAGMDSPEYEAFELAGPKEVIVMNSVGPWESVGRDIKFLRLMQKKVAGLVTDGSVSCLLYTSPSPRDGLLSRMPSSA